MNKSLSSETWQRTGCLITAWHSFSSELDSAVTDSSLEYLSVWVSVSVHMGKRHWPVIDMSKCVLISYHYFPASQSKTWHCFSWTSYYLTTGLDPDTVPDFTTISFPCESAGMWGMTCARPGLFPPSSYVPIFRHTSAELLFFLFFTLSSYLSVNHSSVPSISSFLLSLVLCLSSCLFWELCQLSTLDFHKLQYISEPLWASVVWAAYFVKPHRDLKTTGPLHLLWNPSPPPSLGLAGGAHRPSFSGLAEQPAPFVEGGFHTKARILTLQVLTAAAGNLWVCDDCR